MGMMGAYRQSSVLNDVLKGKFWRYSPLMFLCSFNVDLTLGQVHRPRDLGDIIRSPVEED